jgi:plastocyanin
MTSPSLSQITLLLAVLAASAFAGCLGARDAPAAQATLEERLLTLAAVEYKGGANIEKEPFPGAGSLPESKGYGITSPDETGRWNVNAYRWDTGVLVAKSGETVTLQTFGVNGAYHEAQLEGHNVAFNVTRGAMVSTTFVAGEPGIYRIACLTHAPVMEAQFLVLPA